MATVVVVRPNRTTAVFNSVESFEVVENGVLMIMGSNYSQLFARDSWAEANYK